MKSLLCLLACGLAWMALSVAQGLEPSHPLGVQAEIRVGMLAYRPKALLEQQWAPLARYMDQVLPEQRVSWQWYSYAELEAAINAHSLDFVFTNPAHYVQLAHNHGLWSPLATLTRSTQAHPVRQFGGLILVRSHDLRLRDLQDLRWSRIATPSRHSLGGFMMQGYAIQQAGLTIPAQDVIMETGMPHDTAIFALLDGYVDAAFVRTDVYENMLAEGQIASGLLRILNPREHAGFPFQVSTDLYPEWPFVAMPHVDEATANRIAATLLTLPLGGEVASRVGIYGFSVPLNYQPVEELMRALRLPPFDARPSFTLADVWQRYRAVLLSALVVMLVIMALTTQVLVTNQRLLLNRQRLQGTQKRLQMEVRKQERAAIALRQSDARHQATVKAVPDILLRLDLEGRILDAHIPDPEFFPVPVHQLMGQRYTHVLPEEWIHALQPLLRPDYSSEQTTMVEVLWASAPQGQRYLELRAVRSLEQEVLCIARDVTEQRRLMTALAASHHQLELFFQQGLDGFFFMMLDEPIHWHAQSDKTALLDYVFHHQRMTQVNQALLQQYGATETDFIGLTPHQLFRHDLAQGYAIWRELFDRGRYHVETDERRLDQTPMTIEGDYICLYDDQGRIIGHFGAQKDVTERKQAEQQLRESRDAAEAASRAKSEFLANMSHELRTPLNAVIGLSDILLQGELQATQRATLHKIYHAARMLLGIISDILDYSKIEAGKLELDPRPFALAGLIAQMQALFADRIAAQGLHWTIECDPRIPSHLVADDLRLGQVLANLLSNAIKFTETGQITWQIQYLATVEDPGSGSAAVRLRFVIRDTGIGMSAEQLQRLFQVFYQADTSTTRKYGGTGLGLVISRRLLEQMQASLEVTSRPGAGTCFYFELTLPQAEVEGPDALAAAALSGVPDLGAYGILLVEDNLINQEVALRILEKTAARVVVAEHGQAALERIREQPIDLVLMDLQMPVMDGFTATRALRRDYPDLPIIALSAAVAIEDREQALQAGMNDHLAKPVVRAQLYQTLVRWLPPRPQPAERAALTADLSSTNALEEAPMLPSRVTPSGLPDALYAIAGLDPQEGLRRADDDPEFYQMLLQEFQRQLTEHYLEATTPTQWTHSMVHTLKGTAAQVGATALAECARELDACWKQGSPPTEAQSQALWQLVTQTHRGLQQAFGPAVAETTAQAEGASTPAPLQLSVAQRADLRVRLEEGYKQLQDGNLRVLDTLLNQPWPAGVLTAAEATALNAALTRLEFKQAQVLVRQIQERLA